MTRTVWAEDSVHTVKPDYVAPLVTALCSERPPSTGQLYEAGSGWFAATRWQRARGVDFEHEHGVPSVEQLAEVSPHELLTGGHYYRGTDTDACLCI
jgi:multifunctional beta-oxidation protein